jgi:hypothetical protein
MPVAAMCFSAHSPAGLVRHIFCPSACDELAKNTASAEILRATIKQRCSADEEIPAALSTALN